MVNKLLHDYKIKFKNWLFIINLTISASLLATLTSVMIFVTSVSLVLYSSNFVSATKNVKIFIFKLIEIYLI